MSTFLVILVVAAMIATVVALVRGIATFLLASTREVHGEAGSEGPSQAALKANKMMQMRVLFQGLAILLVAVLLLLYGHH
ncbi:MAG: twin transmembrane helix small protein [Sphingomonas sp.]